MLQRQLHKQHAMLMLQSHGQCLSDDRHSLQVLELRAVSFPGQVQSEHKSRQQSEGLSQQLQHQYCHALIQVQLLGVGIGARCAARRVGLGARCAARHAAAVPDATVESDQVAPVGHALNACRPGRAIWGSVVICEVTAARQVLVDEQVEAAMVAATVLVTDDHAVVAVVANSVVVAPTMIQ